MTDQTTQAPHNHVELLSFRVGEQDYAADIMSVREIRGWTRATPLPHSPAFVRGVINIRGTVLPVLDLADRLGLPQPDEGGRNVIIVVEIGDEPVGLLVEAVSDILSVATGELTPPPDIAADQGRTFVRALTIVNDQMIRVLDLPAVLPDVRFEAA